MPNQNLRTLNLRFFLTYVGVGLAAIFYLPTLVPLQPTATDSYLFDKVKLLLRKPRI